MNNQNENNNIYNGPYKATANMNTMIGNPNLNIDNTMNINIQSMATNDVSNVQNNNNNDIQNYINNISIADKDKTSSNVVNENKNVLPNNNTINSQVNSTPNVNRIYVTTDNKPQKKKLTINLGSEFKVALLIIVILLVFIFILPIITDLIGM